MPLGMASTECCQRFFIGYTSPGSLHKARLLTNYFQAAWITGFMPNRFLFRSFLTRANKEKVSEGKVGSVKGLRLYCHDKFRKKFDCSELCVRMLIAVVDIPKGVTTPHFDILFQDCIDRPMSHNNKK